MNGLPVFHLFSEFLDLDDISFLLLNFKFHLLFLKISAYGLNLKQIFRNFDIYNPSLYFIEIILKNRMFLLIFSWNLPNVILQNILPECKPLRPLRISTRLNQVDQSRLVWFQLCRPLCSCPLLHLQAHPPQYTHPPQCSNYHIRSQVKHRLVVGASCKIGLL